MTGFAKSILIVALFTIGIWLVAMFVGFELALMPSLLLSIVLTALLNLPSLLRRSRS
jgi:hypothetical protein